MQILKLNQHKINAKKNSRFNTCLPPAIVLLPIVHVTAGTILHVVSIWHVGVSTTIHAPAAATTPLLARHTHRHIHRIHHRWVAKGHRRRHGHHSHRVACAVEHHIHVLHRHVAACKHLRGNAAPARHEHTHVAHELRLPSRGHADAVVHHVVGGHPTHGGRRDAAGTNLVEPVARSTHTARTRTRTRNRPRPRRHSIGHTAHGGHYHGPIGMHWRPPR
jgi:hypothetical protein